MLEAYADRIHIQLQNMNDYEDDENYSSVYYGSSYNVDLLSSTEVRAPAPQIVIG